MAYVNQNQRIAVPCHQPIDLLSVNPPVALVPGPLVPVGPINPGIASVIPQIVPFRPHVVVPVGLTVNPLVLLRIEEERSRSLLQFIADEGQLPSPEEEIRRKNAIDKLKQIVIDWIKCIARKHQLPKQYFMAAFATILTYGSYGLGVHNSESDIDALCVGPCFATMMEDFFVDLCNMLVSRTEVSDLHCIKDAKVPLMRFKLDGIPIDLPYAQLSYVFVPENVDVLNTSVVENIDETSWKSLSGVRANKRILQLVPNLEAFQSLLRCIKLWAKRRGVYGNLLGFFGGIHLAILAAFICQRNPNASLSGLICSFFKTFAFWPWPTPVILQEGMLPVTVFATEIRSLMPIRLPCWPYEYCHSNITKSTFYRVRAELLRGHDLTKDLLRLHFDWACLFEPFPYPKRYTRFAKICLSTSDHGVLGDWVGWVKSRIRSLLMKLEEIQGFCDPNPTEYVDMNVAEPNVVFYWGLQPGKSGFVDVASVKDDFVKNITTGYQGPKGKITLSIVQASQLTKSAWFNTGSNKASNTEYEIQDFNT